MLASNGFQVCRQGTAETRGEDRAPVAISLSGTDDEDSTAEVDILDPQPQTLEQAESRAVQKAGGEAVGAAESFEYAADLLLGHDDWEPPRQPRADDVLEPRQFLFQYLAIEKK
jgi:hypothetical protein